MATAAYRAWVRRGRPWHPALPIAQIRALCVVYRIPVLGILGSDDARHLQAAHPQDHCPFSETMWPVKLTDDTVCAIDIKNVDNIGAKILDDAKRGLCPWLKYMNFAGGHYDSRDIDGDGIRWEKEHSGDDHVHISIRTDWANKSIGKYNPWRGTVLREDDDFRALIERVLGIAQFKRTINNGVNNKAEAIPLVAELSGLRDDVRALLARPPLTIDYDQLAHALLRTIAAEHQRPDVPAARPGEILAGGAG